MGLRDFWSGLSLADRRRLLRVDKKALFQRIRSQYCSRCFGLFAMRYDELRGSAALDCPACMEFYSGLVVHEGQLTLEERLVHTDPGPFAAFAEAHARERERELQFMTGDICGSGWQKRPGVTMCALHTSPVPIEAIAEYWHGLPEDHQTALFRLREEDFCAELDAHLKYQLRICRDCRGNVLRAFKELKPLKKGAGPGEPAQLEVCEGHRLSVAEGLVSVEGTGNATTFFERAEEVEEQKASEEAELGDEYDHPDNVRHAETPELAKEALVDSIVLIFKSQVEVAFREQTAGHNALLLFVHLALGMMEERVLNEYKELEARKAEMELLNLVAKETEKKETRKAKRKAKKAAKQPGSKGEGGCAECTALQSSSPSSSPRSPSSPRSLSPAQRTPSPPASRPAASPAWQQRSSAAVQHAAGPAAAGQDGWEVQNGKRRGSSSSSTLGTAAAVRKPSPPRPEQPAHERSPQGVTAVQLPVLHRVSSSSSSVPAARQSSAPTAPGARQPATAPAARDQPSPAAPWAPSAWLRELQEQTDPEWTPWNGSSPGAAGSWGPLAGTSSAKGASASEEGARSHVGFSLFHHSPTSPQRAYAAKVGGHHSLQQSNAQELRAYQLFGASSGLFDGASQGPQPLAPLLRVPF